MEGYYSVPKAGIRPVKMPNGTTVPLVSPACSFKNQSYGISPMAGNSSFQGSPSTHLAGLKRMAKEEHAPQPHPAWRHMGTGIADCMSTIFKPDNRCGNGNGGFMAGFQNADPRPFNNIARSFRAPTSVFEPWLPASFVSPANLYFSQARQNSSQTCNYPGFISAYNCVPGATTYPLSGHSVPMSGAQINNAGQNYNFAFDFGFGFPAQAPPVPMTGVGYSDPGQNFNFDFNFGLPPTQDAVANLTSTSTSQSSSSAGSPSPQPSFNAGSLSGQTLVPPARSPDNSSTDDDNDDADDDFGGPPNEPVTIKNLEEGKNADYILTFADRTWAVDRVVLANKASWFYQTFMDDEEAFESPSLHDGALVNISGWPYLKAFVHWLYNQPYPKAMKDALPDLIELAGKHMEGLSDKEQTITGLIRQPGTELKVADHGAMYLFAMDYDVPSLGAEAASAFKQLLEEKEAVSIHCAFTQLRQFHAFTWVGWSQSIHDRLLLGVYVQDKLLQWMNLLPPNDELLDVIREVYGQCHNGFYDNEYQGYNISIEAKAINTTEEPDDSSDIVSEEIEDDDMEQEDEADDEMIQENILKAEA